MSMEVDFDKPVKVRLGNRYFEGMISGQKLDYPIVTIRVPVADTEPPVIVLVREHCSREAIATGQMKDNAVIFPAEVL